MPARPQDAPATLTDVPLWLAEQHRASVVDELVDVGTNVVELASATAEASTESSGPGWHALAEGAGFEPTSRPGERKSVG